MIVLDTDHLTLLQWGGESGTRIRTRLRSAGIGAAPPTTIISCEEQIRGWMGKVAAARTLSDEIRLYQKLQKQIEFFGTLRILEFSDEAAVEFQRLVKLRVRIGTMDLKIAAIALANGCTVFTRNLSDFRKVPGLRVEDASV